MTQEATPRAFTPAHFIKGIIGTDTITEDASRAHVAFIGRSNVGKSSLMNALLGRVNLVKSSARPGKTTEINYFEVGEDYYFVDLPGYGFARMGEKQREKLRKLIVWYVLRSGVPRLRVYLVIDAQVGMSAFDQEIFKTLQEYDVFVCVVANKIDRLKQQEQLQLQQSLQSLAVPFVLLSARTKRGVDVLQEQIQSFA